MDQLVVGFPHVVDMAIGGQGGVAHSFSADVDAVRAGQDV